MRASSSNCTVRAAVLCAAIFTGVWLEELAHAKRAAAPGCAAGSFVVSEGEEMLGGGAEQPTVLRVQDSHLLVDGVCPASGKARKGRNGTTLSAKLPACGARPKLRLKATVRDCGSRLVGTLRSRKLRRTFAAEPAEALECETKGYPCAWTDVAPAVLSDSVARGDEASAILDAGGTTAEAAQALKGGPLAELVYDDELLRFRLPGGRPVWLARAGTLHRAAEEAAPSMQRATSSMAVRAESSPVVLAPGRLPKRAYVLDPYAWELGGYGTALVDILNGVEDYAGNVVYKANATRGASDITVAEFTFWRDYNVVILDTHGGRICLDSESGATIACIAIVEVGVVGNPQLALLEEKEPGVELLKYETEWRLAVGAEFFRAHYPGGLRDTLVIFNSCKGWVPELAQAIEGRNTNFAAWDGLASGLGVAEVVRPLLRGLGQGRAIAEVYDSLGGAVADRRYGGKLHVGSQNVRIRELVKVLDAFTGQPLTSSSTVEVTGYTSDGEPDGLLLGLDFLGVAAAEGAGYAVDIVIAGTQILSAPLTDVAAPLGEYRWGGVAQLELGFDVSEGQTLDVRVTLRLPEGGASEFTAAPKATGPAKFSPGRVWQGKFTATTDDGYTRRTMVVDATFARDPDDDPNAGVAVMSLTGGTLTWTFQDLGTGVCTYYADETVTQLQPDEFSTITFDMTGSPAEFSGFASTDGPKVKLTEVCPDGRVYEMTTEAGGTWFLAPESEHYSVSGGSVSGEYDDGTQVPFISKWTLHRVE